MRIESQFNQLINKPTLTSTLANSNQNMGLELMCCRIGIVQEFYSDDLTVDVLIVNKVTTGLNPDGSQVVKDWSKIRAKVCYCSPYITHPPKYGDEVLLLFSDREIESWFVNGTTSPLAHSRMHDETDCIAIWGLRSMPNMIQILLDALHLFYGNSDIQLKTDDIISNTPNLTINAEKTAKLNTKDYTISASNSITTSTKDDKLTTTTLDITAQNTTITSTIAVTGNTTQTGTITANVLNDTTAATGTFTTADGKLVTVVNGIIRTITGGS